MNDFLVVWVEAYLTPTQVDAHVTARFASLDQAVAYAKSLLRDCPDYLHVAVDDLATGHLRTIYREDLGL